MWENSVRTLFGMPQALRFIKKLYLQIYLHFAPEKCQAHHPNRENIITINTEVLIVIVLIPKYHSGNHLNMFIHLLVTCLDVLTEILNGHDCT